jgi:hypothetical protein
VDTDPVTREPRRNWLRDNGLLLACLALFRRRDAGLSIVLPSAVRQTLNPSTTRTAKPAREPFDPGADLG